MEIEMKYAIPSREIADEIWDSECISTIGDISTAEKLVMKAVYFDTEDGVLSENNISLRVRAEGEHTFSTLKCGGSSSNGFHERREINVPVTGEECFIVPPVELFKGSEDGDLLNRLLEGKQLINLLETRFLRRRIRITYNDTLMELAIDTGSIVTDKGELPILEMEIELFAGDKKDLLAIGEKFADHFGLKPEDRSKFSRGLHLIREN